MYQDFVVIFIAEKFKESTPPPFRKKKPFFILFHSYIGDFGGHPQEEFLTHGLLFQISNHKKGINRGECFRFKVLLPLFGFFLLRCKIF